MYAVVSSGGKQYRVEPGTTLTVERLGADAGAPVTFDRVLLIGDGDAVTIGSPVVAGATVTGTVLGEELGPKLVVFKFKQKVKYRRRTGHRQHLVRVRIDAIHGAEERRPRARATTAREASVREQPAPEAAAPKAAAPEAAAARPTPRPRRTRTPEASVQESAAPAPEASATVEKPAPRPRAARKPKAKAKAEE